MFLDPGRHVYEISYRTTRQIGFFAGYDELYWNVTGKWPDLPIETASRSPCPMARAFFSMRNIPAPSGRGRYAQATRAEGNAYTAQTTRRLEANEGFTVAVGWQKGIVAPSDAEAWGWWIFDNAGLFVLGLGLVASGLYFFSPGTRWGVIQHAARSFRYLHRRKAWAPQRCATSPATARMTRGFAAALVGLAVKGRLKIADDDEAYTITNWRSLSARPPSRLRSRRFTMRCPPAARSCAAVPHTVVSAAAYFERALSSEFEGKMFLRNLGYSRAGWPFLSSALSSARCCCRGRRASPACRGLDGGVVGRHHRRGPGRLPGC